MHNINTIIIPAKIILSVLLLVCLFNMPYGYYQLVRFLSFIGFLLFAYAATQKEQKTEVIIFVILALLFQPFFKVYLGRILWNIIDVIVALGLIISVFKSQKRTQ